jgi:hypothetical protein
MSGARDDGNHDPDRFARALGRAVIAAWAGLPQAIQEDLFERAVVAGHETVADENLREELARFLHDHHARTHGAAQDTATAERPT